MIDLVPKIYLLLECSKILPSSNIRILSYSHFTMRKAAILVAALLAIATLLAAGIPVLPGSASTIQEAQENPCSTIELDGGDVVIDCDFEGIGSLELSQTYPCSTTEQGGGDGNIWIDCDFEGIGELEADTEGTSSNGPP
jgi:hypothetical protein